MKMLIFKHKLDKYLTKKKIRELTFPTPKLLY